jgi:outer membrane protein TolC
MDRKFSLRITAALFLACSAAGAQQPAPSEPVKLADLVREAEENNPSIEAARRSWAAAAYVPSQAATLPDPQLMVQHFSVGSPRPFAGYTNSDFAYIGFGVSQELPYPGKLKLRRQLAEREAASLKERIEEVRRDVVEQVKRAYFQLAYLRQARDILHRNEALLGQVEQISEARYRVGEGNQQDVLRAQLERTKLLREITLNEQQTGQLEARLKQLLNRPQTSPDIVPEPLSPTTLPYTAEQLLGRLGAENPGLRAQSELIRRQEVQVDMARKDFYPDFNVQYMWQHTASDFRDYYMLTFGVRIPLYRRKKQQPELAQAREEQQRSRREYDAQLQQARFEVQNALVTINTSAELLKTYREGLIPQASATFQAGLAAYQGNRQDFETLLSAFLQVLQQELEYWQALAEHETALARIERLTGATLP